jgi:hypothetical protein
MGLLAVIVMPPSKIGTDKCRKFHIALERIIVLLFSLCITCLRRIISMHSKLALSALVAASLFGMTAIASAQTQPAPGASSEGNVGPGATGSRMKSGMTGPGTTTGSSGMIRSQKGNAARNPSSEGNVGPGTNNNNGPAPGGR